MSSDQPYRDRSRRRITERKAEAALWDRCAGCQGLGHTIDSCPRKWCDYCKSYGDHELIDSKHIYQCPFFEKKRVAGVHEAELRKLYPVMGKGKGAKGKQAGKGKGKGADAAGRRWSWDDHHRSTSPSRDH